MRFAKKFLPSFIVIILSLILLYEIHAQSDQPPIMFDQYKKFDNPDPSTPPPTEQQNDFQNNINNNNPVEEFISPTPMKVTFGGTNVDISAGATVSYDSDKGLSEDDKVFIDGAKAQNFKNYQADGNQLTFDSVESFSDNKQVHAKQLYVYFEMISCTLPI